MENKINSSQKPFKKFLIAIGTIVFSFFLMVNVFPENNFFLPILSGTIFVSGVYIFVLIIDWAKSKGFKI